MHKEVDFIAVGTGLGGISGALAAHDAGAEVLILEKSKKLGGVCAYSGGEVFVPCNHLAEDDATDAKAYLDFLAGGYADEKLAEKLFRLGPQVAKWMADKAGVKWQVIEEFPDYYYPTAPGSAPSGRYLECELYDGHRLGDWRKLSYTTPHMPPGISHEELFGWGGLSAMMTWDFATMGKRVAKDIRGMGPAMMGWFLENALITRGIECWNEAPVVEILTENGRAVGVIVERHGERITVRARKGVLLAIGGYDWNPEMAKSFEGLPDWNSMCQPHLTGDNIILGGELGAQLAGVPSYNLGMFFGYQVPGETHDGQPLWRASWECGYPHAILVNKAGERFADESFYRDYLPRCHDWNGVDQTHPNYPPVLVFDQNYRDKYAFCTWFPGQPVPEHFLAKADTPEELAEKLGVDPAGMAATIERFNSFADTEVDPDFGRGTYPWAAMMTGDRSRPNPNMGPLNKAPYYGIKLTAVGVGVNAVGLKTNDFAQVMHVRGRPIEGLYAAGNSAALLDTGAGYQSGLSNLRGMTWGWVAGRHAMTGE
jgi:3-oxosteroid 1-dehydrogenase